MPTPRQQVPALRVETLDHGPFDLAAETPERGYGVIAKDDIAKDYPARGEFTGELPEAA